MVFQYYKYHTYFSSIHGFFCRKFVMEICFIIGFLSQTHKVGNIGIVVKFVFQYICSVFHYLHHLTLVNKKLDPSGFKMIILQDCRLHGSCSFLMAQLNQSCQYLHYCIPESLWKTLLLIYLIFL